MSATFSPQSQRLDGQTALLTGATSGLGRAIARRLAQAGAHVLVHGRDPDRGGETVSAIAEAGGTSRFVAADLGSHADVLRLAQDVGDIDILVNNAGFVVFAATAELPVEAFAATFAICVRAPFYLVASFAPGMAARGRGSIISVAQHGRPDRSPRRCSIRCVKSGALSDDARLDGRVQSVGRSDQRDCAGTDRVPRSGVRVTLEAAQPQEIADLVAFLVSPAARYIAGATIAADGGRTAV